MVLLGYGIARPMKLMPLSIRVVIDHLRWLWFWPVKTCLPPTQLEHMFYINVIILPILAVCQLIWVFQSSDLIGLGPAHWCVGQCILGTYTCQVVEKRAEATILYLWLRRFILGKVEKFKERKNRVKSYSYFDWLMSFNFKIIIPPFWDISCFRYTPILLQAIITI